MKDRVDIETPQKNARAIENGFPIALISQLAECESWRKEVYRPLSYIHKWWARRLGSVFRAIIIASCASKDQNVEQLLWRRIAFPDTVIFDPFMGSGITIHEAIKLGCHVIGKDINPVAFTMVHAALQDCSKEEVLTTFEHISHSVGAKIRSLYTYTSPHGEHADILYYFWVKVIACQTCQYKMDLFKSRVFAKHAYPNKYPHSKSLCPTCYAINTVLYNDTTTTCQLCDSPYNPQSGTVNGSKIICPSCHATFALIDAVRKRDIPLEERMYAKVVLYQDGKKDFLPIDESDLKTYQRAEDMLPALWDSIPQIQIQSGYNTNQILNYNYQYWYQTFNTRQLVSLALLSAEITRIQKPELKEIFACLFSSILEFNNMFASFKGLGTGAVRPMFSHHILKPELTPLEANPWGTEKSSGSFSTFFESRIVRALDYKNDPFELRLSQQKEKIAAEKIYKIKEPVNFDLIIVCRRTRPDIFSPTHNDISPVLCLNEAKEVTAALQQASMNVSLGDVKTIVIGCLLSKLAEVDNLSRELLLLKSLEANLDILARNVMSSNDSHTSNGSRQGVKTLWD